MTKQRKCLWHAHQFVLEVFAFRWWDQPWQWTLADLISLCWSLTFFLDDSQPIWQKVNTEKRSQISWSQCWGLNPASGLPPTPTKREWLDVFTFSALYIFFLPYASHERFTFNWFRDDSVLVWCSVRSVKKIQEISKCLKFALVGGSPTFSWS